MIWKFGCNMINISLASDSKYCRHMCVAMASVLENASDNVCFYIFDGGISDVQKNKVEKILKNHPESSISYLKVENKIVEKKESKEISNDNSSEKKEVKKNHKNACGLENYAYLCSRVSRERIWETWDY